MVELVALYSTYNKAARLACNPPSCSPLTLQEEIKKQIDWLETTCGIPREKMTSFRAPYLVRGEGGEW